MPEFATQFYPIDIAVVAILLFGAIQGYVRGLSGELARLISTVIAFFAAVRFYRPIAVHIAANTRADEDIAQVLAFAATLIGAVLILLLIRIILKVLIQVVVNERFDKATGLIAGLLRTSLFAAAVLIALLLWPNETLNTTVREKSMSGAALVRFLPHVEALIGAASEHLSGNEINSNDTSDAPEKARPAPREEKETPPDAT
jgi:uncharacterized membrane protein required for colicin V production